MLEIYYDRWTHDFRPTPDGRAQRKVLTVDFRIGASKFHEETDDGDDAIPELTRRAQRLRSQLEALQGAQ